MHRLLHAARVGRREPAAQHEAPVRALAEVALQSLEERRRVDARREREVLAADRVEPAHVTEIRPLPDHGAGNLHPDVDRPLSLSACSSLLSSRRSGLDRSV